MGKMLEAIRHSTASSRFRSLLLASAFTTLVMLFVSTIFACSEIYYAHEPAAKNSVILESYVVQSQEGVLSNVSKTTSTSTHFWHATTRTVVTRSSQTLVSERPMRPELPDTGYDIIVVIGQSNADGAAMGDLEKDSIPPSLRDKIKTLSRYNVCDIHTGYVCQGHKIIAQGQRGCVTDPANPKLYYRNCPDRSQECKQLSYSQLHVEEVTNPLQWSFDKEPQNFKDLTYGSACWSSSGAGSVRSALWWNFVQGYATGVLKKGRKVMLLVESRGSAPIRFWTDKTKDYFVVAAERINYVRNTYPGSYVAAFLWHQGESNLGMDQKTYEKNLMMVVNNFRDECDPYKNPVPFIAGEIMSPAKGFRHCAHRGSEQIINATLAVAQRLPGMYCVKIDGLKDDWAESNGTRNNGNHFGPQSYRNLGHRYLKAYILLSNVPNITSEEIDFLIPLLQKDRSNWSSDDVNRYDTLKSSGRLEAAINIKTKIDSTGVIAF